MTTPEFNRLKDFISKNSKLKLDYGSVTLYRPEMFKSDVGYEYSSIWYQLHSFNSNNLIKDILKGERLISVDKKYKRNRPDGYHYKHIQKIDLRARDQYGTYLF